MNPLTNPVLQAYIGSAVVLGLNLLVLANNTALTRTKASEVINPEDRALNAEAKVVFEQGNDKTERYRRAHRNALENIPLFLITGYLLTLTPISLPFAASLFGLFVFFRLSHSICYLSAKQPWRTASFGLGAVVQFVVLGYLAYAAMVA